IEQDADMVMFLYRPEYYGITEDENGMPTQGTGEVIIAKHRNGSLENVQLKFIGQFTKFCDLDFNYGGTATYGNTFPSGASSNFESSGNTMTFQSKANSGDTPNLPTNDEEPPF
ncbi:DnaB-like helicase C-terminal domain-containing protein, partial [Roseivirga sp. UBA1976]